MQLNNKKEDKLLIVKYYTVPIIILSITLLLRLCITPHIDINGHYVMLEGERFDFPNSMETLYACGWTLPEYHEDRDVKPGDIDYFHMYKGDVPLQVGVTNMTTETCKASECAVHALFSTAPILSYNGIKVGDLGLTTSVHDDEGFYINVETRFMKITLFGCDLLLLNIEEVNYDEE